MKPDITAVITVGGKYDLLKGAIASLEAAFGDIEGELIVVDNEYLGAPGEEVDRERPELLAGETWVDLSSQPFSLHRAWNLGVQAAKADIVGVFNDDVIFGPRCLQNLAHVIQTGRTRACYPTVFNHEHERDMYNQAADGNTCRSVPQLVGPPEWRGYAFVLHKSVLDEVGYFDEQFGFGRGDIDYPRRMKEKGIEARQVHNAFLFHYGQATIKQHGDGRLRAIRDADAKAYEKKWSGK